MLQELSHGGARHASIQKPEMKRTLGHHLARVALLLVSITLTVLVGEAVLRYVFKAWPFEPKLKAFPYLTSKDENLVWRFPAADGRNSLGLRNREVGEKGEGTIRILFLGDSVLWSSETSAGPLFTEVVENNLNGAQGGDGRRFEVINAGVPGYTTYQELEFLKAYGLDMQPDVVVLGFVVNDVYFKYLHRPAEDDMLRKDASARLHRFDTRAFPGSLFGRSYLAHETFYALETLVKKNRSRPYFSFEHRLDFYLAWKDYAWDETEPLIGEMRELLRRRGVRLLVVAFPVYDQVDANYLTLDENYVLSPQRNMGRICAEREIPFLDLTESLYKSGGTALFRDYSHLTGAGNDVVADVLSRHFIDRSQDWFGPPRRPGP